MKNHLFYFISFFGLYLVNAQYCTVAIDCTDNDVITNVEFAGIVNPSSCSTNGYGDYTSTIPPAEVDAGEVYPIHVTVGYGWDYEAVSLWIDFNNNNTFDEDEYFIIGNGNGSIVTGYVEIPESLATGTYRMRINVYASDVANDDPCYNNPVDFGEFEDYLVNVTNDLAVKDLSKLNVSVYPNPVQDEFKIKLDSSFNLAKTKLVIKDLTGQTVKTFKTEEVYNITNLSKGVYLLSITDGENNFTQKLIKK